MRRVRIASVVDVVVAVPGAAHHVVRPPEPGAVGGGCGANCRSGGMVADIERERRHTELTPRPEVVAGGSRMSSPDHRQRWKDPRVTACGQHHRRGRAPPDRSSTHPEPSSAVARKPTPPRPSPASRGGHPHPPAPPVRPAASASSVQDQPTNRPAATCSTCSTRPNAASRYSASPGATGRTAAPPHRDQLRRWTPAYPARRLG